jgi:hypothetical protein
MEPMEHETSTPQSRESARPPQVEPWVRRLVALNLAAPTVVAAAVVVASRSDQAAFLLSLVLGASLMGLTVVSLAAPPFLWKNNGPRSLLVPLSLVIAATISGAAVMYGPRLVLAGTAAFPDTFLRGTTQSELEHLSNQLLLGQSIDVLEARTKQLGFERVVVDTARRVVTLGHARFRTWYEYIYAANGLPAAYSTEPRITLSDVLNWGEVRRIADQAEPASSRPRGSIVFEPELAIGCFQRFLGDSFLRDLRSRPFPGRLTQEEKAWVLGVLGRQAAASSRLIEDPAVTYEGSPPELHLGTTSISEGFWVSSLMKTLLAEGIVERAPDGRHLMLRPRLSTEEQARVAWLHVGLMNFIYGDLLAKRDYVYDRQLREHWYFRRW